MFEIFWKTPEWLHGFKKKWGSINVVVSSKWMKFQFWAKYPFKAFLSSIYMRVKQPILQTHVLIDVKFVLKNCPLRL